MKLSAGTEPSTPWEQEVSTFFCLAPDEEEKTRRSADNFFVKSGESGSDTCNLSFVFLSRERELADNRYQHN